MRSSLVLRCAPVLAAFALPATVQAGVGQQVWNQAGCGGCHTLATTGSSGTGGPNLDQLRRSTYEIAAQVTIGGEGMPSYSNRLSSSQINEVAAFVSAVAGSPAGTAPAASGSGAGSNAPNGMSTAAVRRLQSGLTRLGFFHTAITGFYGPVTTKAVMRFQRAAGLKPDGIWGPKSNAALKRRLSP